MNNIVKVCNVHGDLTIDEVRKDGEKFRCKACRIKSNNKSYYKNREKRVATSMRWKQQNRGDYNEWCKQDRVKNPEKYRRYEENYKKKHGIEKLRKYEVTRIHGLSIKEYDDLILSQSNLCAICDKEETRIGRDKKTLTPLGVDHCHFCEEKGKHIVRGLLCHSCNTALGKFNDDINLLKAAISYLEKHNHVE